MTTKLCEKHTRQVQLHAGRMMVDHELICEDYFDQGSCARWVIGKPGTFVHRCEIIAGIGGSLIVHGDFDLSRFAHYGDHSDAWNRLLWMADHTDLGYYVAQKASIGSGCADTTWEYDSDVAAEELKALIQEEQCPRRMGMILEEAIHYTSSKDTLWGFLGPADEWDLCEHDFGRVLAPTVIINHTALQTCAYLLRQYHGSKGPPACRAIK